MLRRTFLHVPGIGPATERALWADGITTWGEYLDRPSRIRAAECDPARAAVEESVRRYAAGDWAYFERSLSHAAKWRAFGELGDRAVYLDIETDGSLSNVTMVGLYDGANLRTFIAGRDLGDAVDCLEAASLLVSYNGAGFDLPVLRRAFPRMTLRAIHLDLLYPLRRLGYRGGLKAIEERMGIRRSGETVGLDGWDAVRLWREAQAGSITALETLIAYNAEDVRNLEPLARHVYRCGLEDFERAAGPAAGGGRS
jgi:hypothetical protein